MTKKLLEIDRLSIKFPELGFVAVKDSSFFINEAEILALVGESGSGKSLTALSILGLEPQNSYIKGSIKFNGQMLLDFTDFKSASSRVYKQNIRGVEISYIPQDPLSSLNPMYTIFDQLDEAIKVCNKSISKENSFEKCFKSLEQVGIPDPKRTLHSYPHELSGGMRQRVMIAMAIINDPDLIIADEPTTALDVTVQANILEVLKSLKKTLLFITHDLGVVAEIADRVVVMENGLIVEENDVYSLFKKPQEEYTKNLLEAVPKL
jgi:ABC-type dipeptide/oligopeptide/nickel transport system ATPase component